MSSKILIVEDQFIEANNLQMILERGGYQVCPIARSVPAALNILEKEAPDLVLVDIFLQGSQTGIDLAKILMEKGIAFVYLSANSSKQILDEAKQTKPYGFLVKPYRKKDVLVMLDIAWYLHQNNSALKNRKSLFEMNAISNLKERKIDNIIGATSAWLNILDQVKIVAPSDTSVLILGESGTGKEKIADAIHRLSLRKDKPFIKVNCAALSAGLIESELFGHEKGSFTGAYDKRIGKFEMANEGTIFLDEIGELSLDVQAKFLRVLQEKEIERVGGTTHKINVRVIIATNRVLEDEVAAGRFRLDLYYRLNVFPITLPPLRERKEDIVPLAEHFLKIYARKTGKNVSSFSNEVMRSMRQYTWPGNIRELENLVERGVLLANGPIIEDISLNMEPKGFEVAETDSKFKTIEENERDHIIAALEKCNWKIFGAGGAAEILNINVSTLNSRIKKLGIERIKPVFRGTNFSE